MFNKSNALNYLVFRGSRNHIYIATRDSRHGHAIAAAKAKTGILIYIDLATAIKDGVVFYKTADGILLTRGVDNGGFLPARYFLRAVRYNGDGSVTDLNIPEPTEPTGKETSS